PQPPDLEALRRPGDGKESAVVRQMTGTAQEDEVPGIVAAAVYTVNHVVELEPSRRAAAIAAAAAAIAAPHQARDAGRNVLVRPLGRGAIDGSDVLGIAQRAIDRRRIDGDLRAGAFLPALAAAATHDDGDLELRAAGGLGRRRAVEHRAAQRGDERIIRKARAVFLIEDGAGLAQEREALGRELEPDRVRACLGVRRIVRPIARAMIGDELLDLAEVLAAGGREPRCLGRGVATRVSSRTAENASSPPARAVVSSGRVPRARATRSRSWAVRGA
ncbi:MAG TPA: hypothetical protein VHN14_17340, partial [Kofleriaceae bacterium]|nr:hypothetical protein [Kofleriaceae bacterium]